MGEQLVEVAEHRILKDLRVERSHTIHVVRTHNSHVSHPHLLVFTLALDHGEHLLLVAIAWVLLADLLEEYMIDEVNEVHVTGEQALKHVDAPLLECPGEDGVISVCERVSDHDPCLVVGQHFHVNQLPEQLNGGNHRVGVVHLDLVELREVVPVRVVLLKTLYNVLNSRTAEEVLLLQSQLLPLQFSIIGVEHTGDVLGSLALHDGLVVFSVVELLEIEFVRGARSPQSESVCVIGIESWHRGVIGHGNNLLTAFPLGDTGTTAALSESTEEADGVGDIGAFNFPGVAFGEPVVGHLNLIAVLDLLPEYSVVVPDPVAHGGYVKRGEGVEEARSESAEAAVAEGGVDLLLVYVLERHADAHERVLVLGLHVDVHQRVLEHAAQQELQRHVVHTL